MILPSLFRLRAAVSLLSAAILLAGCGRAGGGNDGLYLRTNYAFGSLNISTVYLQGNRIAWNPKGGIDPFDFAAAEKGDSTNVGTYKLEGDKLAVTWGGGRKPESLGIEQKDGQITAIDGGLVSKASAYPKDAKLEATYSGSMGAGSVSAARTLALSKDGRFSLSTLGGINLPASAGGGAASSQSSSSGTYTLSGNTLTLKFADGKTEKHTVMPYSTAIDSAKGQLSDEKLLFEQFMLRREK